MRSIGVPWVVALVALGGLSGCGEKGPLTGTVQGTVTYRGKAVGEGFVIFENQAKGWTRAAKLKPDGSYEHREVPVAEYVVRIEPPQPELPNETTGFRGGGAAPPVPDPKNIPKKFRTSQSTPLRASVAEGDNRYDFELSTGGGASTPPG